MSDPFLDFLLTRDKRRVKAESAPPLIRSSRAESRVEVLEAQVKTLREKLAKAQRDLKITDPVVARLRTEVGALRSDNARLHRSGAGEKARADRLQKEIDNRNLAVVLQNRKVA